ncbi:T9SS type A sorting domain-containing protein [candidate division WOR-3 bacterium]|uniref:T9SS type A sorting domain-containing protein n=1 Tax=candidate division WOR-3 bacterium TaxID=2052148 RepID=A0A9D5QEB8_UNCW3|nr:T9SS type A sorting domain-containing protein [candidate division WOR-3 bacterium]MBD3364890.1 T9SS type A sorting domain-containing protein [candidate division WOR-3 bacterium]
MKTKRETHRKGIAIFLGIILSVGLAYSNYWMGDRVEITSSSKYLSLPKDMFINNDSLVLTIHEVNNTGNNHLAYTFFYLCDPEIGDCGIKDYYADGYDNHFVYGQNTDRTGNAIGSYPGRHLTNAVSLINWYYDSLYGSGVENGEAVFSIIGGDIAVTAEREETQHAKTKLDTLHMPWVPVIGNHDTYPLSTWWTQFYLPGDCLKNDRFFQEEFLYKFKEAEDVFPHWEKQPYVPTAVFDPPGDRDTVACQNWAFDLGPNHHLGLDFTIRAPGGKAWVDEYHDGAWATLHEYLPDGRSTYDWLDSHLSSTPDYYERLIMMAHHPLDFGLTRGCRQQFRQSHAQDIIDLIDNNEAELAYYFAGHEHKSECPSWDNDYDDYWSVGPTEGDSIVEVHFCTGTNRGNWYNSSGDSSVPFHYSVALVKVYSDFVCDYTISPNPAIKGQPISFTSTSNHYGGATINDYGWNFGDNPSNLQGYTMSSSQTTNTYSFPGIYWTKHKVEASNGKDAYMIRRIVVEDDPEDPTIEFTGEWVPMGTGTPGGPVDEEACLWWMDLEWDFNRHEWTFDDYTVYRYGAFKRWYGGLIDWIYFPPIFYPIKITDSYYDRQCMDDHFTTPDIMQWFPEPAVPFYQPEEVGKWKVEASVHKGDVDRTFTSDILIDEAPTCPPPQGGCPEVYTFYSFAYDTAQQDTTFGHVANNTILPHSEHMELAPHADTDILKLRGFNTDMGSYFLNVVENDDEETYIDAGKLWVVDHPENTEAAASSDGNIYVYSDVVSPLSCVDQGDVNRMEEIEEKDDLTFQGSDSSFLTVGFEETAWPYRAILLYTGEVAVAQDIKDPRFNVLSAGGGGWNPIPGGEGYTRLRPYMWLVNVSSFDSDSFRIECYGEDCHVNYVAMVKLETDGWTQTAAMPEMAELWYEVAPDNWQHSAIVGLMATIDGAETSMLPGQQIAVSFDTIPTPQDTTFKRSFFLETTGYYVSSGGGGGGGHQADGEILKFDLNVKPLNIRKNSMMINYSVPYATDVKISIVDVAGRVVAMPVKGEIEPGRYNLTWDYRDNSGRKVASGVYFVKMNAGDFAETNKVVITR